MTEMLSKLNPFRRPKVPTPVPPPTTPTKATVGMEGTRPAAAYNSLISSGSASGLSRKASTKKRSLIGG